MTDWTAWLLRREAMTRGTRRQLLPAGTVRIIHVIAKTLRENIETHSNRPLIGVREAANPGRMIECRHVQIVGGSDLFHTPDDVLPGTDGRGVCYLRTNAALVLYFD